MSTKVALWDEWLISTTCSTPEEWPKFLDWRSIRASVSTAGATQTSRPPQSTWGLVDVSCGCGPMSSSGPHGGASIRRLELAATRTSVALSPDRRGALSVRRRHGSLCLDAPPARLWWSEDNEVPLTGSTDTNRLGVVDLLP